MNWKTHWIERHTWIEITKTLLNWKIHWNEKLLWNAITKTKLLNQSTPSRKRDNMVVGERFSLDVWEVDGWQRDLARLNEVFNVMMETSALISRMTMSLMVLAILTCIVVWSRGVWSIPSKIQWLDESFGWKGSNAWDKVIPNGVNSLRTLTTLTSLVLPSLLPLLLEFPTSNFFWGFALLFSISPLLIASSKLVYQYHTYPQSLQRNWC